MSALFFILNKLKLYSSNLELSLIMINNRIKKILKTIITTEGKNLNDKDISLLETLQKYQGSLPEVYVHQPTYCPKIGYSSRHFRRKVKIFKELGIMFTRPATFFEKRGKGNSQFISVVDLKDWVKVNEPPPLPNDYIWNY